MSDFYGLLQTDSLYAVASPRIARFWSGQDGEIRILFTWASGTGDAIVLGNVENADGSIVLTDRPEGTRIVYRPTTVNNFDGPFIPRDEPVLIVINRTSNIVTITVNGVQHGDARSISGVFNPTAIMIRNNVTSEQGNIVWYVENDNQGLPDRRWYNRTGTGNLFVDETGNDTAGAVVTNGPDNDSQWVLGSQDLSPSSSLWVGHHTQNSVTVSAKVENSATCRIICSLTSDFATAIESSELTPDAFGVVRDTVSGLSAGQKYYVTIKYDDDSIELNRVGQFTTLPNSDTLSEKIAFASCAEGVGERIFDNIANNSELSFFFNLGDMHYADITVNSEALYQDEFDRVTMSTRYGRLFQDLPTYYMWDDHDYGANNTGASSPSRQAALAAFRRRVPSPALVLSGSEDAVYYSFSRGRLRFIVTDLRSEMSDNGVTDNASKVKMSQQQLDWFQDECLNAAQLGHVICWVNTVPWIGDTSGTGWSDTWANYNTQRQQIANFITSNNLSNKLFIISGDAHMLAYDDGTNSPAGVKVLQAAPLDRANSTKGGPYTDGPITSSRSQYGIMEITDNGGETVSVNFKGIVVDRANGNETIAIDQTFTLQTEAAPQNAIPLTVTGIPDGTYSVDLLPVGGAIDDWFRLSDVVFVGGEANIDTTLTNGTELVGVVYTDTDLPTTGAGIYAVVTDGS